MIKTFINTCIEKNEKTAFIINDKSISFNTLLDDVYKTVNLFEKNGLKRGDKALLLVLPSYQFFVLTFACIYYGINLHILDSYKDKNRIIETIEDFNIKTIFCDNLTRFSKVIFPQNAKFVNVSKLKNCESLPLTPNRDENLTVLTTFTSGTTGKPKPIERSISFFKEQCQTVLNNVKCKDSSIVYGGLPIYALFTVYNGVTCCWNKKPTEKLFQKHKIDTVYAPIASLLKINKSCNTVKQTYMGGAKLYSNEIEKLVKTFPNAKPSYVYGASECAIIGITDLDYYRANHLAIKTIAKGVEINLINKDKNGVGNVLVNGTGVLNKKTGFLSNDLGYFDQSGLHIVGRSKYSKVDAYNYLLDDEILRLNPKIFRGFSFCYEEKIYFCYQGRLSNAKDGVIFVKFRKLPMDEKHKTKLDYTKTINLIKKWKK